MDNESADLTLPFHLSTTSKLNQLMVTVSD